MRHSYSRISTYLNCPYQYKLHYIDRMDRETYGVEAFLGTRVHETLEKLYRDINLSKTPSLEELITYYDTEWDKNWSNSIKIVRTNYTQENYKDTGRDCIKKYYEHYKPFNRGKTLAVERPFSFPLDNDGKYEMGGKIDRITLTNDNTYEIHDYKTSQYFPPDKKIDEDIQLPIYQIGLKQTWHDAEKVELVWHFLVFDKEMRSTRTPLQLKDLKKQMLELIKKIESVSEFKPKESALCSWCDYQDICPSKKHGLKLEMLSVNEFMNEPGVELANKYVAAKDEEKLLDERIEKLKGALFAYAKREGIDVVAGSDNELKVITEKLIGFPTKTQDPEKYAELSRILIDMGKWAEVSDLSYHALAKALTDGRWGPVLLEKISGYQKNIEKKRISIRRRKENG